MMYVLLHCDTCLVGSTINVVIKRKPLQVFFQKNANEDRRIPCETDGNNLSKQEFLEVSYSQSVCLMSWHYNCGDSDFAFTIYCQPHFSHLTSLYHIFLIAVEKAEMVGDSLKSKEKQNVFITINGSIGKIGCIGGSGQYTYIYVSLCELRTVISKYMLQATRL